MNHKKTSIDDLELQLSRAAKLLDDCSGMIRDIHLEPHREHIEAIGKSLVNIFSIQHHIYEIDPELMPAYLKLKKPQKHTQALHAVIYEVQVFELKGNYGEARNFIEQFIKDHQSEPSEHIKLLEKEIKRLERKQKHNPTLHWTA